MAFQSVTPVKLGQAAIATTPTLTTLYTTPASTRTIVKQLDVCNTTAGVLTLNVYIVPSAGSAGTGNAIMYGISIPANGSVQWTGVQVMNAGDFIQATASGAGLTITASGGEAV